MPRVQGKLICLGTQFRSHQCCVCVQACLSGKNFDTRPSFPKSDRTFNRKDVRDAIQSRFRSVSNLEEQACFSSISCCRHSVQNIHVVGSPATGTTHTHQAPLIGKSEKRAKACTIIYGGNQIFKSCSAKGRARARVWLFCMLRYFNGPRRAVVCM